VKFLLAAGRIAITDGFHRQTGSRCVQKFLGGNYEIGSLGKLVERLGDKPYFS
jgi:hypothetical protein